MFHLIFSRIDRFNSDAGRSRVAEGIPASAASLLPEISERGSDRGIATAFAFADQLSGLYRNMTHRVLRSVLLLAAALAQTYEIYAEILPVRAVPVVYLGIFAAVCLVYIGHRRIDAQGRYLDYRAVAEGLRVQFFWRVAGLKDEVCANYLRKQLDELRWIRGQSDLYRMRASLQERRHHGAF